MSGALQKCINSLQLFTVAPNSEPFTYTRFNTLTHFKHVLTEKSGGSEGVHQPKYMNFCTYTHFNTLTHFNRL